jgi:hypothetical protein
MEGSGRTSGPGYFVPRKETQYRYSRKLGGPQSGLDVSEKRKVSCPAVITGICACNETLDFMFKNIAAKYICYCPARGRMSKRRVAVLEELQD